jgi:hypothetical protein
MVVVCWQVGTYITSIKLLKNTHISQMDVMVHTIKMSGGTWPISNEELIAKYLEAFTTFINSIDFNK